MESNYITLMVNPSEVPIGEKRAVYVDSNGTAVLMKTDTHTKFEFINQIYVEVPYDGISNVTVWEEIRNDSIILYNNITPGCNINIRLGENPKAIVQMNKKITGYILLS